MGNRIVTYRHVPVATIVASLALSAGLITAVNAATFSSPYSIAAHHTARKKAAPRSGHNLAKLSAQAKSVGKLETVANFNGPMLTGVTVSQEGRIFVNFPHWGDRVPFTVGEVKNGRVVPYPNQAINNLRTKRQEYSFISVQSVVVDPRNRLWVLDTGSPRFAPTKFGGPKLVGVDLQTNRVVKKILFPTSVALPTTYLNDIRFDMRRGRKGMAYITDSSGTGPNGIIVADLDSGRSWRRLNDHPSTKAEPGWKPVVEGTVLMERKPGKPPKPLKLGSDGIAISSDGKTLYYCPLASRHLYGVSVAALSDPNKTDEDVAATVQDLGEKPGASDGLESDAQGRVYVTDYEHHSVQRRKGGSDYETLVTVPAYFWPDTMSVASNGYLYFTANQLHRQPNYHHGKDLRVKPYKLYRIRIGARPVALK